MSDIINRVIPIILLISIGYLIQRKQFLSEKTVNDLRKLVINLALPAVLFISFLNVQLEAQYIIIVVITFSLCVLLYWLGKVLQPRFGVGYEYFPYLMTGFEYGMLGISLYGSAYGLDKIGYFAIVDLGHELFIWFVFLALLLAKRDGISNPRKLMRSFISSPVIIAILGGIAVNLIGASDWLYQAPVLGGVMNTLGYLGNLTVPLILIIVGYGIQLDRSGIKEASTPVLIRLAILLPLAILLSLFLIQYLMNLNQYFQAAMFTLLILPPPFIIPLYMRDGIEDQRRYVNNVLTLYTLISIMIFSVYFIITTL
jgi:predicted permease